MLAWAGAASSGSCPGGGWVTTVKDSRTPFSPTRGCLSGALTLEARTRSLAPLSATLDKARLASGTRASWPLRPHLPSGGHRMHCRRRPPGLGGTLSLIRNPGTVPPTPSCHSHTCFECSDARTPEFSRHTPADGRSQAAIGREAGAGRGTRWALGPGLQAPSRRGCASVLPRRCPPCSSPLLMQIPASEQPQVHRTPLLGPCR